MCRIWKGSSHTSTASDLHKLKACHVTNLQSPPPPPRQHLKSCACTCNTGNTRKQLTMCGIMNWLVPVQKKSNRPTSSVFFFTSHTLLLRSQQSHLKLFRPSSRPLQAHSGEMLGGPAECSAHHLRIKLNEWNSLSLFAAGLSGSCYGDGMQRQPCKPMNTRVGRALWMWLWASELKGERLCVQYNTSKKIPKK